jgi:hypothetical protein
MKWLKLLMQTRDGSLVLKKSNFPITLNLVWKLAVKYFNNYYFTNKLGIA